MVENNLLGTTPAGKELRLKPAKNVMGFNIVMYPGGQLPKAFKGLFTSRKEAEETVKQYLNSRSK